MPLQNRVDPFGQLHAVPDRGAFMGNRGGCFHRPDQTLKPRHWASRQWIICQLEFKGRKRPLMQPGLYTELFFLDEATALAAGHRPCFECRRDAAKAFRDATGLTAPVRVGDMDSRIAAEVRSVLKGETPRETVSPASLPDGAFFAVGDTAFLKQGNTARFWSFSGYGAPAPLPASAQRLTPATTCAALANGFRPALHASAVA
ncbi:hypothetical protein [Hyphomonas chukchiensis]|uniref:Uncharacterized protein n=1 Tax=Hyphomonas chukchiensis TaxID=1280947 RepID=A0A062UKT5_9PROT|nr:hypothetical protein [Hyphomonas chukchiensis]KCZ56710.1 hypothetical protein HY30_06225 [Hyphomonas chukchiensis]